MPGTIRSMTMAFRGDISGLDSSCRAGAQRLRQFSEESKQINADLRRYNQVLRSRGDQLSEPARAGLQARVAGLEERKATMAEARAGRAGLAERLATFKAERAAQAASAAEAVKIEQQLQAQRTEAAWAGARKRIAADQAAAGGSSGAGGMGVAGAAGGHWYDAMGGKRMVKQELKYAAAMAIGAHSPELGLAAMGLMTGGPAGAAAAAIATVAMLYGKAKEQANMLREAQEKHTDRLHAAAEWARKLYEAPTTKLGGALRERAESLDKEVREVQKARRKEESERGLMDRFAESVEEGFGKTSRQKRIELENADMQAARFEASQRRQQAAVEERVQGQRTLLQLQQAAHAAEIAATPEGPARRRAELLARQAAEGKAFNAETLDTQKEMSIANKSLAERNAYAKQRNAEGALIERRQLAERRGVMDVEDRETRQAEQSAIEAEIAVRTEGYARERELLRSKHAFELQAAQEAGRNVELILRRQGAETEALRLQQRQFAVDAAKSRETAGDEWSVLFGGMTPQEAARRRVEREHPGETPGEVEARVRRDIEKTFGVVNGNYTGFDKTVIDEAVRRGVESDKGDEGHKRAVDDAANNIESQRLMQVLGPSLSHLMGPMETYNRFVTDLSSAGGREMLGQAAKQLGVSQDEVMRRAKVAELEKLVGRQQTGQMVDFASGRWQSMQSGVLSKQDVFAEQLEKLKGMLTALDNINRNGVKVTR